MKSGIKGKTPSLIGLSNGRPVRIEVLKKCSCCRCKSDLSVGNDCFGIPKSGAGFSKIKRYCKECFQNIIQKTESDLDEIKKL